MGGKGEKERRELGKRRGKRWNSGSRSDCVGAKYGAERRSEHEEGGGGK